MILEHSRRQPVASYKTLVTWPGMAASVVRNQLGGPSFEGVYYINCSITMVRC